MSTMTIGQQTFEGTDDQLKMLGPIAQKADALLGKRIRPITVKIRPRAGMPRFRDPRPGDGPTSGRAEGYWRSSNRVVLLADDLVDDFGKMLNPAAKPAGPLEETYGHELVHVMYDDHIKGAPRKALLRYLQPEPENYTDTTIGDKDRGYPASPEECIATWGSAALFGFAHPAYGALYKRMIAQPLYAEVKALMLGTEEPDDCAELEAAVMALTKQVAAEREAHDMTRGQLMEAKSLAAQIVQIGVPQA